MSDERFERDLHLALREIAGAEAPPWLRHRLADVTEQPLPRRWSWYAVPLQRAAAAVVLVVVVALAVVFVPRAVVGPGPSSTASPTASPSASPAEPTPTVGPTATLPIASGWTRLRWSSGVLPPEGTLITDILPWHGTYVATGAIEQAGSPDSPPEWSQAFFSSPDGTHWTLVQQVDGLTIDDPMSARAEGGELHALASYGGGLLAITERVGHDGAPLLWRSEDGMTWTRIDSPSWAAAWASARVIAVAGGPTGVVAVGADQRDAPVIVQGADGSSWRRLEPGAIFDHANFRDAVAYGGGFAIVGRDGEPDPTSGEPPLGVGKPAAWISPDGLAWSAAQVEGTAVIGGQLSRVGAGANGLFALGIATSTGDLGIGRTPEVGWASADGKTWRLVGRVDTDQPDGVALASDGTHIVIIGGLPLDAPWPNGRLVSERVAWMSTDGASWTRIGYQGRAYWYPPEVQVVGLPWIGKVWVERDGVIATIGGPVRQWLSFATAGGP